MYYYVFDRTRTVGITLTTKSKAWARFSAVLLCLVTGRIHTYAEVLQ